MSDATEKTTDFLKDLGDAARRNPVSTALIGMGLLWLFTGGKSVGRAGDLFRSAGLNRLPDTAKDALGNVGSRLGAGAESVRDIANSTLSTSARGRAALSIKLPISHSRCGRVTRSKPHAKTSPNSSAPSPWHWEPSALRSVRA